MPLFSNQPPADDKPVGYRLVRTPPIAKFTAHVLSHALVGCPTHFVGNRTVPCETPDCEPCDNGIGHRWHGYLLVQVDASQEVVIFEMTQKASESFQTYHQRHGTLRGCHFQATRLHQKPNGRVLIQCKTGDLTRVNLPEPKSVERLLCHIWNIAPLQTETHPATPAAPVPTLKVHRDRPELNPANANERRLAHALNDLDVAAGRNGDRETTH